MPFEVSEPVSCTVGEWLAPRLTGDFGSVARHVPDTFAAYARILHPSRTTGGLPVGWATVARRTGRIAHRLMQWEAITVPPPDSALLATPWMGSDAMLGNLSEGSFEHLVEVLAIHTGNGEHCVCGHWEGWSSWLSAGPATSLLSLPGRQYLLRHCRLDRHPESYDDLKTASPSDRASSDWQSPNLLWPADRSWFVNTEVDFDSTLVGGSRELIADLLVRDDLEAWSVLATDSIADTADTINLRL